jgi:hypothetical protein
VSQLLDAAAKLDATVTATVTERLHRAWTRQAEGAN